MLIYKLKSFDIFCNEHVSFLKIFNKKFFFLEKYKTYIMFPESIYIKKYEDSMFFIFPCFVEKKAFNFLNYFLNFFRKLTKYTRKKLTLVGLGFRITVLDNNSILSFKLGFSHLVNIKIPKNIKVVAIKNNIYLEGSEPVSLGRFASSIKNLKYPDNYKGKGFWFRSEKKKLKPVKKV